MIISNAINDNIIVDIVLDKSEFIIIDNRYFYDELMIEELAIIYINRIAGPHELTTTIEPVELDDGSIRISYYFDKIEQYRI